MPRKGENIYKRKDGRWEGRIQRETAIPGSRSYLSVYGKTYKEVKGKMQQVKNGHIQTVRNVPDMEKAAGIWLADRERYWKPTTCAAYRQILGKYIVPYLGKVKVNRMDNRTMENFAVLLREKSQNMLSADYLFYICGIAVRILIHIKKKYGYEIMIPDNPIVKGKKAPLIPPGEHSLSVLEKYLAADSERDINLGILTAFYTGIRIGELCALKWEDIDLADGIIYIRRNVQRIQNSSDESTKTSLVLQTPKTADSMRIIPIPPVLFPLLEKNRKDNDCYVIAGTKHPWADPRTVQYQFKGILEKCGLEYFNFHMLRHAFASRCIAKGFDAKSLSEILGHSDIRLTLSRYVHSTVQQKKQLMNLFDSHLNE